MMTMLRALRRQVQRWHWHRAAGPLQQLQQPQRVAGVACLWGSTASAASLSQKAAVQCGRAQLSVMARSAQAHGSSVGGGGGGRACLHTKHAMRRMHHVPLSLPSRQQQHQRVALRHIWSRAGRRRGMSAEQEGNRHAQQQRGQRPASAAEASGTGSGPSAPSWSATTQTASARVTEAARHTYLRFKTLEDQLRWHGINMLAVLIATVIGSALVAIVLYFNREPLRDNLSSEISTAAKRSLSNQEVVAKANEVTRDMVHAVLTDPQTVEYASQFVAQLFAKPETRQATAKLLVQVMKDEECLKQTQVFFRWVVDWLSKDKVTQENLTKLILYILAREDTRRAVVRVMKSVLQDPTTRKQAGDLSIAVLQMDTVKEQTGELARDASHRVLDNEDVRQHAAQFFKDTFADQGLQKEAGSAIWSALKYSMTPSILGYIMFPQPKVSLPPDDTGSSGAATQQQQQQQQQPQQKDVSESGEAANGDDVKEEEERVKEEQEQQEVLDTAVQGVAVVV